jgi:hypothetical protein
MPPSGMFTSLKPDQNRSFFIHLFRGVADRNSESMPWP